ncbi:MULTISPECIES: hypothetical protein [unclassified Bradyrhizobium]|uniref:hypothetical protein n=1 Tax=unclassified Bradyrhizobium TaxID=2631580 RepID=UPI0012EC4529|nr:MULTISPECIES: hypothetical protein [unclassified Bradyrhizobium]MCP3459465.1 hypothetical protein [Bradyrhizobium sp. CCGUVB23]
MLRTLPAQIVQQCADALMIALNCCAWPMQLYEARQNLQGRNRHGRAPLFATQCRIERKAGISDRLSNDKQYTFPAATAMCRGGRPDFSETD